MWGNTSKSDRRSGQATVEYLLIVAVVVILAGVLSRGLLVTLDSAILGFGGKLEKNLKTGRAPLNAYVN